MKLLINILKYIVYNLFVLAIINIILYLMFRYLFIPLFGFFDSLSNVEKIISIVVAFVFFFNVYLSIAQLIFSFGNLLVIIKDDLLKINLSSTLILISYIVILLNLICEGVYIWKSFTSFIYWDFLFNLPLCLVFMINFNLLLRIDANDQTFNQ